LLTLLERKHNTFSSSGAGNIRSAAMQLYDCPYFLLDIDEKSNFAATNTI
jgi:hypothetical protein